MANPFIKKYVITNDKPAIISVDHEAPVYRIVKGVIKSDANKLTHYSFDLQISKSMNNEAQRENLPQIPFSLTSDSLDIIKPLSAKYIRVSNFDILEIRGNCSFNFELELHVENSAIEIDTRPLFIDFKYHLDLKNNSRILFSAPFGKGKTTFLNLYFEEYNNEYEVFHLYPVNYSVASNEDIFKYIKAELLLQLLTRCDDFQYFEFNNNETLVYYFNNLKQDEFLDSFTPFIKCIPKVGETTFKFVEPLIKLYNSVKKVKQVTKIDEKKEALDYIKTLSIKEGSIFEDDLYTQLIRSLIKHFGKTKNKKTVFIIDDLDRLDPEHIFRILNILSAHFDNHLYISGGDHNKFGFDKIIITCDYHNIYNIYSHKFGEKTDFKGYINKYYSTEPYFYENEEILKYQLRVLFLNVGNEYVFQIVLKILLIHIDKNLFTIRDLINLIKLNIINVEYFDKEIINAYNSKYLFFVVIYFLEKIYTSKETIKSNIHKCALITQNSKNGNSSFLADIANKYGLSYYCSHSNRRGFEVDAEYANIHYRLEFYDETINNSKIDYWKIQKVKKNLPHEEMKMGMFVNAELHFSLQDFFKLLLINIEEYYKQGGLKGKGNE